MKKDIHYTKPRGYSSYTPNKIIRIINTVQTKGGWVRPIPYYSLVERLRQAWDVFTYRADALYWKEPEP